MDVSQLHMNFMPGPTLLKQTKELNKKIRMEMDSSELSEQIMDGAGRSLYFALKKQL